MAERKFMLTPEQVAELTAAYKQTNNGREKRRYQAVRMYGTGYSTDQIIDVTCCSRSALMGWVRAYQHGGVAALADHYIGGNRAKLTSEQIEQVKAHLQQPPAEVLPDDLAHRGGDFWTIADLRVAVKHWFGVTWRHDSSYRDLLHRCDFSYHKAQKQYKRRTESEVSDCEAEITKTLDDVAQNAPNTVLLVEDEAKLYLQATTSRVWYPKGKTPIIRTPGERRYQSFYGFLNVRTGEEIALPSTKLNGEHTAQCLAEVLNRFPDVPILIWWDKAPWHGGPFVKEILENNPRLQVKPFATAAPDMNPQEHVWKMTRSAVSHNHTHDEMEPLTEAFLAHLNGTKFATNFLIKYGHPELLYQT
jgi:transposase